MCRKLSRCIQALNAQPVDLVHIAEVTDIQFASVELVAVAAKCLAELVEVYAEEEARQKLRSGNTCC